jgi:hypothetical protein
VFISVTIKEKNYVYNTLSLVNLHVVMEADNIFPSVSCFPAFCVGMFRKLTVFVQNWNLCTPY